MPGRLFLTCTEAELAAALGMQAPGLSGTEVRRNMAPGQQIAVLTEQELVQMRWGIIPVGRVNARGRPVMETLINARSETVFDKSAYEGVGRAVVPVHGWYEWTGEKRRKTAWRIRAKDAGLLYFAAITDLWKAPGGLEVPQVATVTCAPNADVAKIHHRMGVLLRAEDLNTWIAGTEAEATALMQPWPEGQLHIEEAKDVNWEAP